MKIQFGHPRVGNYREDFYLPLRENFKEHTFLFPHEEGKKSPNSRETLKNHDIFLCEVTLLATGLGIEIGFASVYGIRIICLYRQGVEISGSLKYVTDEFIEYTDSADMIRQLETIL